MPEKTNNIHGLPSLFVAYANLVIMDAIWEGLNGKYMSKVLNTDTESVSGCMSWNRK